MPPQFQPHATMKLAFGSMAPHWPYSLPVICALVVPLAKRTPPASVILTTSSMAAATR